jgi:protein tyrosine/serine phosphatase
MAMIMDVRFRAFRSVASETFCAIRGSAFRAYLTTKNNLDKVSFLHYNSVKFTLLRSAYETEYRYRPTQATQGGLSGQHSPPGGSFFPNGYPLH